MLSWYCLWRILYSLCLSLSLCVWACVCVYIYMLDFVIMAWLSYWLFGAYAFIFYWLFSSASSYVYLLSLFRCECLSLLCWPFWSICFCIPAVLLIVFFCLMFNYWFVALSLTCMVIIAFCSICPCIPTFYWTPLHLSSYTWFVSFFSAAWQMLNFVLKVFWSYISLLFD